MAESEHESVNAAEQSSTDINPETYETSPGLIDRVRSWAGIGVRRHVEIKTDAETGMTTKGVLPEQLHKIEKPLSAFAENWSEATRLINEFQNDEEVQAAYNGMIREYRAYGPQAFQATNRKERRQSKHPAPPDMNTFVDAVVMLERLDVRTQQKMNWNVEDIAGMRDGWEWSRARKTCAEKWKKIKESAENGERELPNAARFYGHLDTLGGQLQPLYKNGEKGSDAILGHLKRFVGDNPEKALELISTLETLADSSEERYNLFLQLVATDAKYVGDQAALHHTLRNIEHGDIDDFLIDEFLKKKSSEQSGDNAVEFMRKMHDRLSKHSFEEYMREQRDQWPSFLETEYVAYSREYSGQLRRRLEKMLQPSVNPSLVPPSVLDLEKKIDQLMSFTVGAPQYPAEKNKKRKRFNAQRSSGDKNIQPAVAEKAQSSRYKAMMLTRQREQHRFDFDTQKTIEDKIDEISSQRDPEFAKDLRRIISYLEDKPRPVGSKEPVDVKGIMIGDKHKKFDVLRFNPNNEPGFSVGRKAKDARVIYSIIKREDGQRAIGVIDIVTDHDHYERIIRNL